MKKPLMHVFDVDGTLTPSRLKMDAEFKKFFLEYFKRKEFCLVSGSDYTKLREQVGDDLLNQAKLVFPCSGNSIFVQGTEVYKSDWQPQELLLKELESELRNSNYRFKTGGHMEHRPGMLNFSTIGRRCSQLDRETYYAWDQQYQERAGICKRLRERFPDLAFEIGGQISIDIYPQGADKSQILPHLADYTIYFFGDGIQPGHNDYSLAQALSGASRSFPVNNWSETKEMLDNLK
jgi:phosphomannomutase